jgi:hypothetical protein
VLRYKLFHDGRNRIGRNGESKPLCEVAAVRILDDECVDADHLAREVQEWPPRVAVIIAASVWISPESPVSCTLRFSPLTTPAVTEPR